MFEMCWVGEDVELLGSAQGGLGVFVGWRLIERRSGLGFCGWV